MSLYARIASGECRNDAVLSDVRGGSDDGSSGAGEVVAVGFGNALDETRQRRRRIRRESAEGERCSSSVARSARRTPAILNLGFCNAPSRVR